MKPQRTQREIMFKNSVNSLVFANQEACQRSEIWDCGLSF